MDFRKELAKELGLGAIAENTMLDDYVKACEAIAIRYHDSEVKKLNEPAVSKSEAAFYCQSHIEGQTICSEQCDHCKEYYAPLERQ